VVIRLLKWLIYEPYSDIYFKRLYLTFLSYIPNADGMKQIANYQTNGVAKSKLTLYLIEKHLEVEATTRN
jgi:hypothetical protein